MNFHKHLHNLFDFQEHSLGTVCDCCYRPDGTITILILGAMSQLTLNGKHLSELHDYTYTKFTAESFTDFKVKLQYFKAFNASNYI